MFILLTPALHKLNIYMYMFHKSFIVKNVFDAKHLSAKQNRCGPSQRETCLGAKHPVPAEIKGS